MSQPPADPVGPGEPPSSGAGPAYPPGASAAPDAAAPPVAPYGQPGDGQPYGSGPPQPTPPGRRAVVVTSIVLGIVLLLCAGGGTTAYFLVTRVGSHGKATPSQAVDGFLDAVFNQRDAEKASTYVCNESRDKAALGRKIDELRRYADKYRSPRFTWTEPQVDSRTGNTARLTVPVTVVTEDDRTAQRTLSFVAVKETGWYVCEVRDGG